MKKRIIWISGLIIILIIVIGLLISYKNQEQKSNNEEVKEVTISELMDFIYDYYLIYADSFGKSFKSSELTNKELNKFISMVFKDYFKAYEVDSFSKNEVEAFINQVFGDNINYEHSNLYCEKCNKYHILYDKEKEIYYENKEEKHDEIFVFRISNSNLEKKDDKYMLNIRYIYATIDKDNNYKGFYANYQDAINDRNIIYDISTYNNNRIKITEVGGKKIEELKSSLQEFIYTFEVVDDQLVFTEFEIIK